MSAKNTLDLGGTPVPIDIVTESNAILGKKGSGKTNAGIVLLEETYRIGVPVISIDPKGDHWGIRAGADGAPNSGLPIPVFGGLHGDVPLESTAGAVIANLLREKRLSAVLDVSEFSSAERRRFLTAFVDSLYRRPEREPMHLLLEEAHEYIPQRVDSGDAAMVGAFERIVKMGRFKGLGVTMMSQRSASLNKNVLTQVDNLFMLRTLSPQDRAAVKAWIDVHAESSTIIESLPTLATGECWLWQPERGEPVRFRFRQRRTYDAGATPKPGEKPRPQATLADIDLDEVRDLMAETIERAKAEDPKALRAQITDLRRQLDKALAQAPERVVETVTETFEVPVSSIKTEQMADLRREVDALRADLAQRLNLGLAHIADVLEGMHEHIDMTDAGDAVPKAGPAAAERIVREQSREQAVHRKPATKPAAAPNATPTRPAPEAGDIKLRSGAVRMLESLGRMHPLRLTKAQWGTVAKLKTSGGTWSTYLSDLRRLGFIDENAIGYTLTDAGFDQLGGRPEPMTAIELQDHYRRILRSGAVKMLDAIMAAYPDWIDREAIGEAAELATSGGTFSTYLSDLTRNGLVEKAGSDYRATDILMRGAQA